MKTEYKILQQVHIGDHSELKVIDKISGEFERHARNKFKYYTKEYPDRYFELVKVQFQQDALDWTGKPAGGE